jgi:hypothetical protein
MRKQNAFKWFVVFVLSIQTLFLNSPIYAEASAPTVSELTPSSVPTNYTKPINVTRIYTVDFQLQPYHNLLTTPDEIVVNGSNIEGLEIKINARTYSVSGIAKDKDGNLLANERIHIFSPSTSGWGGRPTTNPDGTFTVKGLPNGTYLLKFGQNPSDPIAQGEVTINNGDVQGLVIQGI